MNFRAQKELVEKERGIHEKKHQQGLSYAQEIRQQIREKEQVRIQERSKFFEEGVKLDQEARARRHKIDDIKRKKLQELR